MRLQSGSASGARRGGGESGTPGGRHEGEDRGLMGAPGGVAVARAPLATPAPCWGMVRGARIVVVVGVAACHVVAAAEPSRARLTPREAKRARRRGQRTSVRCALEACGAPIALGGELRGMESSGGFVAVESRHSRWPWDVQREAERLGQCESAWGLLHHPEHGFVARPWGCTSRLCPVCWASKAGNAAHTWWPVLEAALRDGARIYHLVLTQRPISHPWASALVEGEQRRWIGTIPGPDTAPPERPLWAVAGESCIGSYRRWYRAWRQIHTERSARESGRWRGVGVLRGVEWTLRRGKGRAAVKVQAPRWHCHGHMLIVVPKGVAWDPRPVMRAWARASGLGELAMNRTKPRGGRQGPAWRMGGLYAERIRSPDAVLEVLKYPYKPGAMTAYGTLDAWACLRGTRTHHVAGALHSASAAARDPGSCWAAWLGAKPHASDWGLLQQESTPDTWVPCLRRSKEILDGTWSGADRSPYTDRTAGELRRRRFRIRVGGDYVVIDDTVERFADAWALAVRRHRAGDPDVAVEAAQSGALLA